MIMNIMFSAPIDSFIAISKFIKVEIFMLYINNVSFVVKGARSCQEGHKLEVSFSLKKSMEIFIFKMRSTVQFRAVRGLLNPAATTISF